MLVDEPRPIICPICTQRTSVKGGRITPHLSGMRRGYCTGTGMAVQPYQPSEFDPKGKWRDPDDEESTQDP